MNKQEVINKIENISARETFLSEIIWIKRDEVLDIVKQLDEPENPVLRKEELAEYGFDDLDEYKITEAE